MNANFVSIVHQFLAKSSRIMSPFILMYIKGMNYIQNDLLLSSKSN